MTILAILQNFIATKNSLSLWLAAFVIAGFTAGVLSGFFRARKIQPKGFRWKIFRNEILFSAINLGTAGFLIGYPTRKLTEYGFITYNHDPASWWVVGLEFAVYFFAFDCYFYWMHRWMHTPRIYKWVHKVHHYSTSPNLLTSFSETPLESLVNGGFVPLFLTVFTVHDASLRFILPFNVIMGLYVHSGYEFFPRWWHKSWTTRWFITATFHDQHHKYFRFNYGGYTTIWDRLCGTMRPQFLSDFDKLKAGISKAE
jgi:sterol desaturase/sphingolipid hydroxylase (fatty acid hydroxylase superfamily)